MFIKYTLNCRLKTGIGYLRTFMTMVEGDKDPLPQKPFDFCDIIFIEINKQADFESGHTRH